MRGYLLRSAISSFVLTELDEGAGTYPRRFFAVGGRLRSSLPAAVPRPAAAQGRGHAARRGGAQGQQGGVTMWLVAIHWLLMAIHRPPTAYQSPPWPPSRRLPSVACYGGDETIDLGKLHPSICRISLHPDLCGLSLYPTLSSITDLVQICPHLHQSACAVTRASRPDSPPIQMSSSAALPVRV